MGGEARASLSTAAVYLCYSHEQSMRALHDSLVLFICQDSLRGNLGRKMYLGVSIECLGRLFALDRRF